MQRFLDTYKEQITGVISVFDRMIFKGYLSISYPQAAEKFLARQGVLLKDFQNFTTMHTARLKLHAQKIAQDARRPYEYLRTKSRMEDEAREMAKRDGITEGLICVFARNEENHSYGLRYGKDRPHLVRVSPKSMAIYFYYMDRHFGLMHIRLSTWMPFSIQVYINGHEWLARQMSTKGIAFEQHENAFTNILDCTKAQQLADKMPAVKWEKVLHVFARRVNPLLNTILSGMEYYWVIDQAEYATDIMVKDAAWFNELYTKWQKHAAVCFQAEDIMGFMGRKLHGSFNSTIVTNVNTRPSVTRIRHTVRGNWIKMYNKHGIVLRVETVINRPQEFRVFRLGHGKKAGYYQPLRKGVTNLRHYARLSLRSNSAYLDAIAVVADPTNIHREIKRICEPAIKADKQVRPLNPLREHDRKLFEAAIRGEHHLHGFKAVEFATLLGIHYPEDPRNRKKVVAKVNRKIGLLRGHGLVARHGRSRRYRITELGSRHMNAAINLYHVTAPAVLNEAA